MEITELSDEHHEGCLEVIASLPEWFGYPGAAAGVATALAGQRGFVALESGKVIGFVTIDLPFPESLEITYLAVAATSRRTGIGRSLLSAVQADATSNGVPDICLLTLGLSSGDANYRQTVLFYEAMGFRPLKELELSSWGGAPALLLYLPIAQQERPSTIRAARSGAH